MNIENESKTSMEKKDLHNTEDIIDIKDKPENSSVEVEISKEDEKRAIKVVYETLDMKPEKNLDNFKPMFFDEPVTPAWPFPSPL